MCPNHNEHALEKKLTNSYRLTERLKLWQKHSLAKTNENLIKESFLRKQYELKHKNLNNISYSLNSNLKHDNQIRKSIIPDEIKFAYRLAKNENQNFIGEINQTYSVKVEPIDQITCSFKATEDELVIIK
jgi:hypothetical protein